MIDVILASASPRRRMLLEQIGVSCDVQPANICEDLYPGESPQDYTRRLALEKARVCQTLVSAGSIVIAADTTVSLAQAILGKPEQASDALDMLMRLSGQTHQVTTGVAVLSQMGEDVISVTSDVEFAELTEAICYSYWQTGEPLDKAGSYAIQGYGAVFVKHLSGSYSNVVGLPLHETSILLKRHGARLWSSHDLIKGSV